MDIRHLSVYDQNCILKKRLERYESEGAAAVMKDLYEKKLKAAEYRMERSDKFWHNCLDKISSLKRRNRDFYRENRCLSKEKRQAEKRAEKTERLKAMVEAEWEKISEKLKDEQEKNTRTVEELMGQAKERGQQIEALKDEVARLQAILGNDGTTSGLPASKTPAGKKKSSQTGG